jgi:glucan 1,3-beta-glucosidase
MAEIGHQGRVPLQHDTTYQVFRNVKDYGTVRDGVTDDTAAINLAFSNENRCAPGSCASSTTTPATIYFPAGTYLIRSSIINYYYTNLIGNPNCIPTLKATMNFTGLRLVDGELYGANGLSYEATNVFWMQVCHRHDSNSVQQHSHRHPLAYRSSYKSAEHCIQHLRCRRDDASGNLIEPGS